MAGRAALYSLMTLPVIKCKKKPRKKCSIVAKEEEKDKLPNKTSSQWNEVFADVTIVSAILDRVLHHCTVINIEGESYRLKEHKEFIRVQALVRRGNP